jgi:membrane-associated phospholipid phosphatase
MHLPIKPLAAAFVAACIVREIRCGYFKSFKSYLPSVKFKALVQILALTVCVAGCALIIDQPLAGWARAQTAVFFTEISRLGGLMGKGANPWFFMGIVYCLAALLKRERWSRVSFACMLSSAITAVAANLLKITFLRARPFMNWGDLSFFNYQELFHHKKDNFFSFPSGDVAVVAGAAAYLFYSVQNIYFRSLFLVLPLMTAFSRIYKNKHWPSDTLFSIGLGLAAALFVVHYERFVKTTSEIR